MWWVNTGNIIACCGGMRKREEREISGRSEKEVERDGKREGRENMA